MAKFELQVDASLGALFRRALGQTLEEAGFVQVGDVALPRGPHLREFRRGDDLLSFSYGEAPHGKDHLLMEGDTVPVADLVRAAVRKGAEEFCRVFLTPLGDLPEAELRRRIERSLQGL